MATMYNTPEVYLMDPMLGVPWFEVHNAPADYDARAMVRLSADGARDRASKIRCRGTRSPSAREKARLERHVALCESALADWADDRCERKASGVLVVHLARRVPAAPAAQGGE